MDNFLQKTGRLFLPADTVPLSNGEKIRSALATFVAIYMVFYISSLLIKGIGLPILVASMGASAVLLFAVPHSPLSQPWSILAGNVIATLVGVSCAKFIPNIIFASAIAVSVSLLLMQTFRCLHPPGGAMALLPLLGDASIHELGYGFVLQPVALNISILLVSGLLINNVLPGRRYPARLLPANDDTHKHKDSASVDRLGISQEDVHNALKQMNTYLDVSEADLNAVYKIAGMQSYRRKMGEITCAEIMSRDMVTVEYGTELEEAWALLQLHNIKAIPVIDKSRRVIGIITLMDFLRRANLKTYETFQDKLIAFIKRTPGLSSAKPEVAGQIMASPVYSAKETMHIVELVPLLSERGLHHLPIVDAERRLTGMVTQSDLIAALYAGSVVGK